MGIALFIWLSAGILPMYLATIAIFVHDFRICTALSCVMEVKLHPFTSKISSPRCTHNKQQWN